MELTSRLSDERLAYVQDATLDEIDECFNGLVLKQNFPEKKNNKNMKKSITKQT